jgi:hypothetical protein
MHIYIVITEQQFGYHTVDGSPNNVVMPRWSRSIAYKCSPPNVEDPFRFRVFFHIILSIKHYCILVFIFVIAFFVIIYFLLIYFILFLYLCTFSATLNNRCFFFSFSNKTILYQWLFCGGVHWYAKDKSPHVGLVSRLFTSSTFCSKLQIFIPWTLCICHSLISLQ